MVHFNSMSVKDNIVTINNEVTYKLSDSEINKLLSFLATMSKSDSVSQDTSNTKPEKAQYTHTKDLKCVFDVEKRGNMYTIHRVNGWTRAEKKAMNEAIKNLDGIITIPRDEEHNYISWGYKTKKKAEEMMAKLPKVIKAEDLNKL